MKYALVPRAPEKKDDYRVDREAPGTTITQYMYKRESEMSREIEVLALQMECDDEQQKQLTQCMAEIRKVYKRPGMQHAVMAIRLENFYINLEWDISQGDYPFSFWVMDMSH